MIKLYTHFTSLISLSIQSIRACFIILFIVVANALSAQTMSTCGASTLNGADILANATPALNNGHDNNGFWAELDGLISDNPTDINAADHNLSGFTSGNTYRVVWEHNGGGSSQYVVNITATDEVSVVKWEPAVSHDPCIVPYKASVNYEFSGTEGFNIAYTNPQGSQIGANMPASATLPDNTNTDHYVSTSWQLTSVIDANGCVATNLPQTADFSVSSVPSNQTVIWGSDCTSATTTIQMTGSEVDIEYILKLDNNTIEGPIIGDGSAIPFSDQNTAGTYGIYAINTCAGVSEVLMGSIHTVYKTPSSFNVSTKPSGNLSLCESDGATITLSGSELDVDYYLYHKAVSSSNFVRTSIEVEGTGSLLTFSTVNTPGFYKVVAENACGSVDMDGGNTVEVIANPTKYNLQDVNGSSTVYTCDGSNVALYLSNSESGVSYQVYNPSGVAVGNAVVGNNSGAPLFLNTTANTSGIYTAVATKLGSLCVTDMEPMEIVIAPLPTATMTTATYSKCPDKSTSFSVPIYFSPSGQGPWDIVLSTGVAGEDIAIGGINSNPYYWQTPDISTQRTYWISSVSNGVGCINTNRSDNTGEITIEMQALPDVSIDGPDLACEESQITLDARVTNLTGGETYLWNTGATGTFITPQTPTVANGTTAIARYDVTVTSTDGCSATAVKNVTVHPNPEVSFTCVKYIFCENDGAEDLKGFVDGSALNDVEGAFFDHNDNEITSRKFVPSDYAPGRTYPITFTYTDVTTGCEGSHTEYFTVNPVPVVSLEGFNESYCFPYGTANLEGTPKVNGDGNPGVFITNPNPLAAFTDNLDGTGTFNMDANSVGVGTYTFTYRYTTEAGCADEVTKTITLHPRLDDTTIHFEGLPAVACESADPVTLTAYFTDGRVAIGKGEFRGPGIIDVDDNDGIAEFDPGEAGAGTHTIEFYYRDEDTGCNATISEQVTIGTPLEIIGIAPAYCSDDNTDITLQGGIINGTLPTPDDTYFDLFYVKGNDETFIRRQDNNTTFSPNALYNTIPGTGDADYKLVYYYTEAGCINTLSQEFSIVESIDPSFTFGDSDQLAYCVNGTAVDLKSTADATENNITEFYNGKGIVINSNKYQFNPAVPGIDYTGANPITHVVHNTNQGITCKTELTRNVSVRSPNFVLLGYQPEYCINSGAQIFKVEPVDVTEAGIATFVFLDPGFVTDTTGNTITIDPNVTPGLYEITVTWHETSSGCEKTEVFPIEIFDTPAVNILGFNDGDIFCSQSADITIEAEIQTSEPGSGSFDEIGTGLVNSGINKATLSPANLPVGNSTITFNYIYDSGICATKASKTVTVVNGAAQIHEVTGGGAYCHDDATLGKTIGLKSSTANVVYELYRDGSTISSAVTHTSTTGGPFNFQESGSDKLFTDPGTYTIRAMQSDCSSLMNGEAVIEVYQLRIIESKTTPITCYGETNATINVKAEGGSGNYEYSLTAASYTTVWNTTGYFDGLGSNTYSVNIKDASSVSCEETAIETIIIADAPNEMSIVTSDVTHVGCEPCTVSGTCEGSATINIAGGTPFNGDPAYPDNYNIYWHSTGGTGLTETGMPGGNNKVTITDANGCNKDFIVFIPVLDAIEISEVQVIDNKCNDWEEGSYIVEAAKGSGNFEFNTDDPLVENSWLPSNVGVNQYQVTNLKAGSYYIWVRDKNYPRCFTQIASPIVITEPDELKFDNVAPTNLSCYNINTGEIELTVSGGASEYEFTIGDPNDASSWVSNTPKTNNVYKFQNLFAGNYTIWLRDALNPNCDYTSIDVQLTEEDELKFTAVSQTDVSCYLGSDGRVQVVVEGGVLDYVYNWTNLQDNTISYPTNQNFIDGLESGDYSVEVYDANGCGPISHSFTVEQPTEELSVDLSGSGITETDACENNGSIQIQVNGGTSPYTIKWSNGDNTYVNSGLAAGFYTVDVIDAKLCNITSDSWEVKSKNPIEIIGAKPKPIVCNGDDSGELHVEVGGGSGSYEIKIIGDLGYDSGWRTPSVATPAEYNFDKLLADNYTVQVRDANNYNCINTGGPYNVSQVGAIVFTVSETHLTCNNEGDGIITVNNVSGGSGNYKYILSGTIIKDYTTTDLSYSFTGLDAGAYTVSIEDADLIWPETCVSPNPEYVILIEDEVLTVDNVTEVSAIECVGGTAKVSVIASGRAGNYVYIATPTTGSAISQENPVFELPAGDYNFTVIDKDNHACSSAAYSFTISDPEDFKTDTVKTDVTCSYLSDGTITLTTTYKPSDNPGNFEYSIDGGNNYQASNVFDGLDKGTYNIKVRKVGTTCVKDVDPVEIKKPDPMQASFTKKELECFGGVDGEIDLDVKDGNSSSYTYLWTDKNNNNVGTNAKAIDLTEGKYFYKVWDSKNCLLEATDSISIDAPDKIEVEIYPTDIEFVGESTGSIRLEISGGPSADYTVNWLTSPDDVNPSGMYPTGLPAGDYSFEVESGDCTTETYYVTLSSTSDPMSITLEPIDAPCNGGNGSVKVLITSGLGPYTLVCTKDGVEIEKVEDLNVRSYEFLNMPAGTYQVTVTDSYTGAAQVVTEITTIKEPLAFSATIHKKGDIVCYGTNTGWLNVQITGDQWDSDGDNDISKYSIEWYAPNGSLLTETGQDLKDIDVPGEYTVKVYYGATIASCPVEDTEIISNPSKIVVVVDDKNDLTCFEDNTGFISVSASGVNPGDGGFTYNWTFYDEDLNPASPYQPLGNSATISDLEAGNYKVKMTAQGSGCIAESDYIRIDQPDKIAVKYSKSDITTCHGDDSGQIRFIIENRIATKKYFYTLEGEQEKLIGDDEITVVISNLAAGTYRIQIRNSDGCTTEQEEITITQPEILNLEITKSEIDCENPLSGEIEFKVSGGLAKNAPSTQNYNLSVKPVGESEILLPNGSVSEGGTYIVTDTKLQNLAPNTYTVNVIDANSTTSCFVSEDVILANITLDATPKNPTCFGVANGSITGVQINGASNLVTFKWEASDGGVLVDATTLNQANLPAGTYTLVVTDAGRNSCKVEFPYELVNEQEIRIEETVLPLLCHDSTDGAINIVVKDQNDNDISNNCSYNWTAPVGITIDDPTKQNQGGLVAGEYVVEVITGDDCPVSKSIRINPVNPITYTLSSTNESCSPYKRTLSVTNVSGGSANNNNYTYRWSGGPLASDPTKNVVTVEQGGTYTVQVSQDGNCPVSRNITVADSISIDYNVKDVSCAGAVDGAITLTVNGGSGSFDFEWTYPDNLTSEDQSLSGLKEGTYKLEITDQIESDGNFCVFTDEIIVDAPEAIGVSSTTRNASCNGSDDGFIEIVVSGGTGDYVYHWSPLVGDNIHQSREQNNLPAGSYTVTVTDDGGNGCEVTKVIVIEDDAPIVLSVDNVKDTSCDRNDGSISISASGGSGSGFTYDWSATNGGSGLEQDAEDQTGLTGGWYSVKVTDKGVNSSACSVSSQVIALTPAITIANKNIVNVSCLGNNDGGINFNVVGGSGNYTYEWSVVGGLGDESLLAKNDPIQQGISEGKYKVVITDTRPSGVVCSITDDFEVFAATELWVKTTPANISCFGASTGKISIGVTGGTGNYTYTVNGKPLIIKPDIADTANGEFQGERDDEGNLVVLNLSKANYEIVVKDDMLDCPVTQNVKVDGPELPLSINQIDITPVKCYGASTGAILATVKGGTEDYDYYWSLGPTSAGNTANPTDLQAGTYRLRVVDAKGCDAVEEGIVIAQPAAALTVDTVKVMHALTEDGTEGSIEIKAVGGEVPYNFTWYNNDDLSDDIGDQYPKKEELEAGSYKVEVTDDNQCTAKIDPIIVKGVSLNLKAYTTTHNVLCYGSNDGEIEINVDGGTLNDGAQYTINVTGPNGYAKQESGSIFKDTGLTPGKYQIKVSDSSVQGFTDEVTITQPAAPLAIVPVSKTDVTCFQGKTGIIEGKVSGGTPSKDDSFYTVILIGDTYSETKEDVTGDFTFVNLPAGEYVVRVEDASRVQDSMNPPRDVCYDEYTTTITQPHAQVSLVADSDINICDGGNFKFSITTTGWDFSNDNNLIVNVHDGYTPNAYTVTSEKHEVELTPLSLGRNTYKIVSVNKEGDATCSQGEIVGEALEVMVNSLPSGSLSVNPQSVCPGTMVTLKADGLSGAQPLSITWRDNNNGTTGSEDDINQTSFLFYDTPVATAEYQIIEITDSNGCTNYLASPTVEVVVNDLPEISLSGTSTICEGDSATLNIGIIKGAKLFKVFYDEVVDDEVSNSGSIDVDEVVDGVYDWEVSPKQTTTYKITGVKDGNGCEMDLSIPLTTTVTVNPFPKRIDLIKSNSEDVDGVCQGSSNIDFFVDPVDYAVSYEWEMPKGITIISGAGTSRIITDFSADFNGGNIGVKAVNSCGDGPTTERWISNKQLPENIIIPPTTDDTELCEGQNRIIISTDAVDYAAGYEWDIPTGLIPVEGEPIDGTSITVDVDPNVPSAELEVRVRPYNDCNNNMDWSPVLEINITPLPRPDAGNDERICNNQYTLQAAALNVGEEGEWKILKGTGRFQIDNDRYNPKPLITNLSQGENIFEWTVTNALTQCSTSDTVIINNDQLTVTAIVDQTPVCGGEATVNGTPLTSLIGADIGYWSFTSGGGSITSSSSDITTVTNLNPGENVLRWTVRKGSCESYAEVSVVNNQPTEAIIYYNNATEAVIDLCDETSTNLTASEPIEGEEEGYWHIESGQLTIDKINSTEIEVTDIQKGNHRLTWNIVRGACTSSKEIIIRNNSLEVNAGLNDHTCDGSYQLLGSEIIEEGVTGLWTKSGNADIDTATIHNPLVTGMDFGDNVFTWTLNRNGCKSSDTVIIRNDKPQDAAIVGDVTEIEICGGEATMVAVPVVPDMGVGSWSLVTGSGKIENPLDPNTKVTGIGQGENVFRWTVALKSCQTSIELTVTNLEVEAYAGPDQPVCEKYAQLSANEPLVGGGEWNLVPGEADGGFTNRYLHNPIVSGLAYGENKLVWTVTNGSCISRDTVVITVNKPNPVNAGSDQTVVSDYARLNAIQPDYGSGMWTLVEGGGEFDDPTVINPIVTNIRRGQNIYRWTVSKLGCSDYDEVTITNGTITEADAGPDSETCDDYITLGANDPDIGLGEWSIISGEGTIEDSRNPKTKVTDLGQGDNIFKWTIYYTNETSEDSVIITSLKPSDADAGIDARVCVDQFVLEGKPPVDGIAKWSILSGGGVFNDVNDPQTTITGLAPGENVLKYEIDNTGCTSIDTVIITNDTPSIADGGPDQTICADSVQMKPITPQYGVGTWKVIKGQGTGADGGEISGRWIYNLAPGENQFEWRVQVEGSDPTCYSSDTVTIINNKPSDAYAGQSRPVCVDNVFLSASEPIYGVGTWELLTGAGIIVDPTDKQTQVTDLGKGKNRFRWTIDNNGCTSESEVEISYDLIEAFAGFERPAICADTAVLAANEPSPGIGSWSIVGGSGTPHFTDLDGNSEVNNPYATVRDLDRGENVLVWTIRYNSCVSTDTIVIVNDMPSTAVAGDNVATCNNSIILGASVPNIGDGVWTIQTGGGDFEDIYSEVSKVNNLKFGKNIFRWNVTHKGCSSYSDVEVAYNKIDAEISETFIETCSNEVILSGNNASPGIGEWSVVSGNSQAKFDDNNNPTTRVYDLARGTNRLEWRIEYEGCITTDEVEIINHNPSTAYAGSTQELCSDVTSLRATTPAVGTGTWSILSGSATIDPADLNNPFADVTNLSKGENKFLWTVTSANGMCSTRDEVSVYNNVPSIPYAGEDGEFCSPTVTLKAATPDYGEGLWSIIEGGGNFDDPSLPNATITNLQEGVNKFRWTISVRNINGDIGCSEYDEVIVTNNTPTPANAGPDIEDCKDYALLDANVPTQGVGEWSTISGNAIFANPSDPKTRVDGLSFGENILQWKVEHGSCTSVDQVTIFNKVPTQSEAGVDKSTCDDYYPLNANTALSGIGVWSVVSGKGIFDDVNDPSTVVRGLGLGENKLKWTITYGGCSTEDMVVIESNKADPYAGEDDISYESSYDLKASNPGTLSAEWSLVAGTGTFEDNTFYNTTVNNLTEGINTFRWTMNVKGCITSDDVSIEYRVVPEARFESDVNDGCVPLTVRYTNHSFGGYSFLWNFGQGDVVSDNTTTSRNAIYTFRTPGTYTVTLTVHGPDGEDGVFTDEIVVHPSPKADFNYGPDIVYAPNGVLDCRSLAVGAAIHEWDFGDGNYSSEVNPQHKYEQEGIYTLGLQVESEYGCLHDTTIINAVEVKNEGFVAFPTAFTPRPDGGSGSSQGGVQDNSVFKPVYKDVDSYKLQIFNRWGQLLYESNDIEEGWNGFFNNQLSPQAVYVWKASGIYNSGRGFNDAGSVLLVR